MNDVESNLILEKILEFFDRSCRIVSYISGILDILNFISSSV